jgi:glucokinase
MIARCGEAAIGIDVGGTKIAAGAVDVATGKVRHRCEMRTPAAGAAPAIMDAMASVLAEVAAAIADEGRRPTAVGVGLPELVSVDGEIGSAHLGDWTTAPVGERLGSVAPALVTSDVRASAAAEARFGAGRGLPLFAFVSIGTGISSTIVLDGTPIVGARGGAVVFASGTLAVPCGQPGEWAAFSLEQYASGQAIARRYRDATGAPVTEARPVVAAAERGDGAAIEIVESAATALGSALGWLVNLLDPDAIVIGGGLGLAPGRFRQRLAEATRAHIWNPSARGVPLLPARLGADAGIVGAALIASDRVELGQPIALSRQ